MEPNQPPKSPNPDTPSGPSEDFVEMPKPPVQFPEPSDAPHVPSPVTSPDEAAIKPEAPAAPVISQTIAPKNDMPSPPPPFNPASPPVVTVGDGGIPAPTSAQVFTPISSAAPVPAGRRRLPKALIIGVLAAIVVIGGASAFYFGYYTNPSVIYSQSLHNTGKGYDQLVDYIDKQTKLDNKGFTGNGTYQIKAGGFSTDGKLGFKSNGQDGDFTFDVGLATTRISADIRTIKSSGTTPDIYLKASGIKGLGTTYGEPSLDPELAKLDNNWIVVDHTLLDDLDAEAAQNSTANITPPTHTQIFDEARAFGKVNQDYVFTTDKKKAVTEVVKRYGIEEVDGHKTYHYKIAFQKDNVRAYILAQRDALKASSLNDWLVKNKYDTSVYSSFTDAADSAKDIKASDTYDVWMDASHRVFYKIRFNDQANPAENYVDLGFDYKGGDQYPFFISGKTQEDGSTTNVSFVTTVDTKTNNTDMKLNVNGDGTDAFTVTSDFSFKPSASTVAIDKPTGAISVSQVMSDLGYSTSDLSGSGDSGQSSSDTDTTQLQTGNKVSGPGAAKSTSSKVQIPFLQHLLSR